MPETVRASRMPSSRPLITTPTTWPRCSSSASEAAMGTSIWAATEPAPTTRPTAIRTPMSGDEAETTRPAAVTTQHGGHQPAAGQQVAQRHQQGQAERRTRSGRR